jgi:hypothetical protein
MYDLFLFHYHLEKDLNRKKSNLIQVFQWSNIPEQQLWKDHINKKIFKDNSYPHTWMHLHQFVLHNYLAWDNDAKERLIHISNQNRLKKKLTTRPKGNVRPTWSLVYLYFCFSLKKQLYCHDHSFFSVYSYVTNRWSQ